ncbi:MAG: Mur ligase family protein, partial [Chitinophagaceae bacterium]
MTTYPIEEISSIVKAEAIIHTEGSKISYLLTDSRNLVYPDATLFIALITPSRNGHQFIPELYEKGVRNFLTSESLDEIQFPKANFLKVSDTLKAIQKLAAFHRKRFHIPVIGITGSNGKTIVKEWLFQLLNEDYRIVRSPKSYNSQIGVPLSVWQMEPENNLAIIEAGISQPDEMINLEKIILPTIGIFTNIGDAHNEG